MLHIQFSSPEVLAYSAGRQESLPDKITQFPTVTLNQTHTNNIAVVTTSESQTIPDCDAVITQLSGVLLKVRHADCLPILVHHPSGIIAAIHAGRKGTQANITQNAFETLRTNFSIEDQAEVWFGPCICKNCYQIDKDTDLHYDLLSENARQIRSVFSETQAIIQYSNHCTAHENENFYSYRTEGKGVPMNWSGIARL